MLGEANVGRGSAWWHLLLVGILTVFVVVGVLDVSGVIVPLGTRRGAVELRKVLMIAVVVVLVVRFAGWTIPIHCVPGQS